MSERSIPSPLQAERNCQLIRKQRLLEKVPVSKSTLHAWLDPKSRYHNKAFPRPIYFPGGRIPYWNEAAVDAYVAAAANEPSLPLGSARATAPRTSPASAAPVSPMQEAAIEPTATQAPAKPSHVEMTHRMPDGREVSWVMRNRKRSLQGGVSHSTAN